jgi:tetratricopeptide (TPR) repeat protein
MLTIISPIFNLISIGTNYEETHMLFKQYPGLKTVFYVDTVLCLIMVILSIRAGIALWTVKSNAVQTAKTFLIIFLGYSFIEVILPFTAGLPSYATDAVVPLAFVSVARSIISFSIWYSYLNVSKRVKATYSGSSSNENEDKHYERGNDNLNHGNYMEAIDNYNEAIRLKPNYPKAYNNRGSAYFYLNNSQKALEDYSTALSLELNYSKAFNNRGFVYEKLQDYQKAIEDYKETINIDPGLAATYENLGRVYLRIKDYSNAILNFKKCLEIDNGKYSATVGLALTYNSLEDIENAKIYLKNAVDSEPKLSEEKVGIEKLEKGGWYFSEEEKGQLKKLFEMIGKGAVK